MTGVGEVALWIALLLAGWGALVSFLGGARRRGDLVLSGERASYAVWALLLVAAVAVIASFLGDEYHYLYVAGYSNRELATYYKVTGLWAGHAGSLVLWGLMLSSFAALAVFRNRRSNRDLMPYVAGTLHLVLLFFLVVILFTSNPFEQLDFTPADGRGLNPQLQNYWMTIHPPTLYLGFTAFTVPFAFAVAALLSGRLDTRWIAVTRRWTLAAWFFLTCGIVMGMIWAYETLGWGGYWFWDPVENASLLPWLTGTAFLHSVMIQEKRGMLKAWNLLLILGTFILTIFATFLTRSGLIESVHSFARNLAISYVFLGFLGVLAVVSAGLVWWRRDRLESESRLESFLSREAAFLTNNLLFVGAMIAVMWGTMFPLISEAATGQEMGTGPEYFDSVNVPLGLILLALMGIGPVIGWRKASPGNLRRNFSSPLAAAVVVGALLFASGVRHTEALLTFTLATFALVVNGREFWKGARVRAVSRGERWLAALVRLVARNRRRYGGYLVHAGIIVIFSGFAGSAYDVEEQATLAPGEEMTVASPFGHEYRLTYLGTSWYTATNMTKLATAVEVAKDGERVGVLTPELRAYSRREESNTRAGIRRAWNEDLYLVLAGLDDPNGVLDGSNSQPLVTFRALVNPLVSWIWLGAVIVAAGTLIALWPERTPRGSPPPDRQDGPPAATREQRPRRRKPELVAGIWRLAVRRSRLAALLLLLGAPPLVAQTPGDEARAAIGRLKSPYCPGLMLEVCPSGQAAALRDSIHDLAGTGMDAGQLVAWTLARHGEEYRAVPQRKGFGVWAWLIPPGVLLLGALLVAWKLRGLGFPGRGGPAPAQSISSSERARLEHALGEPE
ncbi:MAG: cytochrome c-type biogenesis CcmF C-terminal domain-containing protein [Longimicrobiaceae bacterium]